MKKINTKVLVSDANYFNDSYAINSYMDDTVPVDLEKAKAEHAAICNAFTEADIEVVQVPSPSTSQDGVYTANWALTRGSKAVMANLPNMRESEEAYAEQKLKEAGFETVKLPKEYRFSGQGDALPCGNLLFVGTGYRTSKEAHPLLARELGYEVVSLQTIPERDEQGSPTINPVTGWEDSFFYDLDLAISIISPSLIAWCPEAFMPESQEKIHNLSGIEKIEVSLEEAMQASACNLVSTGETVIMGSQAPQLRADLEARGLKVIAPDVSELMKGGGFIRCCSLTLINE